MIDYEQVYIVAVQDVRDNYYNGWNPPFYNPDDPLGNQDGNFGLNYPDMSRWPYAPYIPDFFVEPYESAGSNYPLISTAFTGYRETYESLEWFRNLISSILTDPDVYVYPDRDSTGQVEYGWLTGKPVLGWLALKDNPDDKYLYYEIVKNDVGSINKVFWGLTPLILTPSDFSSTSTDNNVVTWLSDFGNKAIQTGDDFWGLLNLKLGDYSFGSLLLPSGLLIVLGWWCLKFVIP